MAEPRLIALTGGIGSGKSTVAGLLAGHGAVLIDSDVLAREVVEPGTPGLAAVVERFGAGVLRADGSLDRPALGALVFSDDRARVDLNALVHPRIRARARELRAAALASDPDAVIVDVIPLLVETGQAGRFDEVIVVDVPVEAQVQRVMARDGLRRDQVEARLAAQATREERLAVATRVVANDGSRSAVAERVSGLWEELTRAHPAVARGSS